MKRFLRCTLLLLGLIPVQLAAADANEPVSKIAFGSCSQQTRPLPIWKSIVAQKPQLFLHLGDIVYADTDDMTKMKADYEKLNSLEDFKALRKICDFHGVWDDHDYGKNDAGVEYPKKVESQAILLDFLGVAKDSERRSRKGVYHAQIYGPVGKRVQIILLDGRYHRSSIPKGKFDPEWRYTPYAPNTDPSATILGEEQWKWLEEQLKIPAEIRIVGSGIQFISKDHPFEKWANFPLEREKFFKLLRDTKAEGVILLSGDRHLGELSMLPPAEGIGYPLYDITSSGLNQASKNWRAPEKNSYRVSSMAYGDNFGQIEIDWSKEDPLIKMQLRDVDGDIIVQQKIPFSLLKASSHLPKGQPKVRPFKLSQGAISATDAKSKVGEKVIVEMEVMSVGGSIERRIFLNSHSNYRDEANFAVVLSGKLFKDEKFTSMKPDDFKGKIIRVSGTVALYKDRQHEIVVDDPNQLELLQTKK